MLLACLTISLTCSPAVLCSPGLHCFAGRSLLALEGWAESCASSCCAVACSYLTQTCQGPWAFPNTVSTLRFPESSLTCRKFPPVRILTFSFPGPLFLSETASQEPSFLASSFSFRNSVFPPKWCTHRSTTHDLLPNWWIHQMSFYWLEDSECATYI